MKVKSVVFLTVLIAILSFAACGHLHTEVIDAAIAPTGFLKGATEGKHCSVCQEILIAQQPIDVIPPVKIDFPSGSITAENTIITTDHLKLNIPANVYIPDDLVENINIITSAMEIVSGMNFEVNPKDNKDRLSVEVIKMTEFRNELLSRMIHLYGFENENTIAIAHMCETYPQAPIYDKVIEILVESHEIYPVYTLDD